jgi:prepilin-type N-terminal cleavage/methylation domain-containing protein
MSANKGFTLIELLIVIALIGVAAGVSSDIILSLVKTYTKTQIANEVEQNANFAVLKMEKELKRANIISAPAVGAGGATTITFVKSDGTSDTFNLSGGVLQQGTNAITNNDPIGGVTVSCGATGVGNCANPACFSVLSSNPYTVGINLKFARTSTTETAANICTTLVLRGSY